MHVLLCFETCTRSIQLRLLLHFLFVSIHVSEICLSVGPVSGTQQSLQHCIAKSKICWKCGPPSTEAVLSPILPLPPDQRLAVVHTQPAAAGTLVSSVSKKEVCLIF